MTTAEHITIRGLPHGERYRSRHRYTPEQAEEIRELTLKIYQGVWDEIDPGSRKVMASAIVAQESDA